MEYFGIPKNQNELAATMNKKLPDDQTGWLGTYDYELVSYLNNQLFGDQPQSETDTGYGLQSLTIQDYNDTTLQLFKYRIIHNIKDGYPSFIQIQVDDLFGNDSNIETPLRFWIRISAPRRDLRFLPNSCFMQ